MTTIHPCCRRLRPGLVLVAVNGVSVAGVGPAQLTHVLAAAPLPLRLTFLAHPLALLRAQHARLQGRFHDLGAKAGRLAALFRRREAAAKATAAAYEQRMAVADSIQTATAAALRTAQGEAASLRAQLAPLREALRVAEGRLATYTGSATSAQHAALAQRRLTGARGPLALVALRASAAAGSPRAVPPPPPASPRPSPSPASPDKSPTAASPARAPQAPPASPLRTSQSPPASPSRAPQAPQLQADDAATSAAVHAAAAPLRALLAAAAAVPPVTRVGADGVMTVRVGAAVAAAAPTPRLGPAAAAGSAAAGSSGGSGYGGVALFDPLFPDLLLTQASRLWWS